MFLAIIHGGNYSSEETIQGRKLFKGGNYWLLGHFECDNYSREETICGNAVCRPIVVIFRNYHCLMNEDSNTVSKSI